MISQLIIDRDDDGMSVIEEAQLDHESYETFGSSLHHTFSTDQTCVWSSYNKVLLRQQLQDFAIIYQTYQE